jgi:multisubunit Na+/H+ antiporter MnhB subunit
MGTSCGPAQRSTATNKGDRVTAMSGSANRFRSADPMIGRWMLAGVFGVACLAAAYTAFVAWSLPDGGGWMFVAFAALFLLLTWSTIRPPKKQEPTTTRFAPSWMFDLAILFLLFLFILGIVSCILRKG